MDKKQEVSCWESYLDKKHEVSCWQNYMAKSERSIAGRAIWLKHEVNCGRNYLAKIEVNCGWSGTHPSRHVM